MKQRLLYAQLIAILTFYSLSVLAQDGNMQGIDAYFMEEGYFDNIEDALGDIENAYYLDLSLQSPKLKKIPTEVFQLKKLKYLELGFNQVESVGDSIEQLTQLEVLGLSGNKYLKTVSEKVLQLPKLKELYLQDTGLSPDRLNAIALNLPQTCKLIK